MRWGFGPHPQHILTCSFQFQNQTRTIASFETVLEWSEGEGTSSLVERDRRA
jgi:hypothetical protein